MDNGYKQKLESYLRKSGYSKGAVDKALEGVDGQIKTTKTNNLIGGITQAMQLGRYDIADVGLAQLAQENPTVASVLMARSPSSVQAWGEMNKRENAKTAHNWKVSDDNTAYERKIKAMGYANDLQQSNIKLQHYYKQMDMATQAQIASAVKAQDSKRIYDTLVANGISEQEAAMASVGWKGLKASGGGSSNGEPKPTQAQIKTGNALENLYQQGYSSVINGDANASGDAVEAFREKVEELADKGDLNSSEADTARQMAAKLLFLRAKKAGNENEAYNYWRNMDDDFKANDKDLSAY